MKEGVNHPSRRLALEFVLLFFGVPAAYTIGVPGWPALPVLWVASVVCAVMIRRTRAVSPAPYRMNTGSLGGVILRRLALGLIVMITVLWFTRPDQLAHLPRTRPLLWLAILVLYPWLSVVPQGIVYRAFFFHRYGALFPSERARLLAAAVTFSFSHIVFRNGWALVWTLPAGWLFARTYRASGSLGLSNLEHTLYGAALFTIGWGAWFFHGITETASVFCNSLSIGE